MRAGLSVLVLGIAGCTMPTWTPDTVPLLSQAGPVTAPYAATGCYQ